MSDLNWKVHDGSGPYLLLVHGMLSSRNQWLPNLDDLAKVCRPVTVELYGHHEAPTPIEPDQYLPESYVDQFEKIRTHLQSPKWFVCGSSLGAALTMRYALTHSHHVHGQIFTNSNSALADPTLQSGWKSNAEKARSSLIEGGLPALDRIAVHPRHAKRLPSELKDQLVADSRIHSPLGIANTMTYTTPVSSVRNTIQNNSVPSLLVCGKYEKRFQVHREFAERHMPHLRVTFVSTSHAVSMEAASEFNHEVCNFIRSQS